MRTSYRKWLSLDCLHDYFADGVCTPLSITPTRECARILDRYGCRFRPRRGGGDVYYADTAAGSRLAGFREQRPLGFTLQCDDALLETYTESDLSGSRPPPSQSCYYFTNLARGPEDAADEGGLLLHPAGGALSDGPIRVREAPFMHRFDAPVRAAALALLDQPGRRPVWEAKTPSQEVRAWNIDVGGLPTGVYTLTVDGSPAMTFYRSDEPAVRCWGVIEIFSGSPEDGLPVDKDGRPPPRAFSISLASRKTTWRYHIIDGSPGRRSYDDYTVVGMRRNVSGGQARRSGEIPFARVQPKPRDPEHTLLFESREPIVLRQSPSSEHIFSFVPGDGSTSTGLKLPYALAANTRLATDDGSRGMYSDIFVYL